jgi:hypothetical protein
VRVSRIVRRLPVGIRHLKFDCDLLTAPKLSRQAAENMTGYNIWNLLVGAASRPLWRGHPAHAPLGFAKVLQLGRSCAVDCRALAVEAPDTEAPKIFPPVWEAELAAQKTSWNTLAQACRTTL